VRSFFLVAVSILSLSFVAQSGPRLELSDDRNASPAELRKRIRQLQESVIDLQTRVDNLEAKLGVAAPTTTTTSAVAPVAGNSTCYIETPFDGLFDATAATETKARIEAVKACMAKVKSRIHCSSEKVKCGQ
jgi:uncharacterized protein YceH (UPF0502 family)